MRGDTASLVKAPPQRWRRDHTGRYTRRATHGWACCDRFVVHQLGPLGASQPEFVALGIVAGAAVLISPAVFISAVPVAASAIGCSSA